MNVSSRSLLSVSFLTLGIACAHESTTSTMTARVLTRSPGAARDATGLRPADGAQVALSCPDGTSKDLGRTDSRGELKIEHDGTLPLACSVTVTEQGFQPLSVKVADVCTELGYGGCQRADLRTVLAAAAGSGSAGGVR
jgi:hypothetical protein